MHFFKFFLNYLLRSKTRQGLLIMAMMGLFISSFCLVLVQGVLTGLQGNRIERSKSIIGEYVIKGKSLESFSVLKYLEEKNYRFNYEYELEGLLKNGNYITPVIVHGLFEGKHLPEFLEGRVLKSNLLLSSHVASKAMISRFDEVQIISPSHTDSFFGDLPRYKTLEVQKFINSKDPGIDEFHVWTDLRSVQSLIKKREINIIRIYDVLSKDEISAIKALGDFNLYSWRELNQTLAYALALENNVVLFLFLATVVLVGLSILSGLSIFYNRLKQDFVSFWILGMSLKRIKKVGAFNVGVITVLSLVVGNLAGLIVAYVLEQISPVVMPEMFVDRSLPVIILPESFLYSFVFPAVLTIFFTAFTSERFFTKKSNFLNILRSVGR